LEEESFACLNKIKLLDKIVQGKGFEPQFTGIIQVNG
jgi:hypothetical protein